MGENLPGRFAFNGVIKKIINKITLNSFININIEDIPNSKNVVHFLYK